MSRLPGFPVPQKAEAAECYGDEMTAAELQKITDAVAARMIDDGEWAYWSEYDSKWLVRKNCNLAGIVYSVVKELEA